MPTRSVVLSEHQQQRVGTLVQSSRYQNASEVLREGLRLIEERDRIEDAKLKALKQAARQGWADVSAGRYADIADNQLEDFVGQIGRTRSGTAKPAEKKVKLKDDQGHTRGGMGKHPDWFKAALSSGKTPGDLLANS